MPSGSPNPKAEAISDSDSSHLDDINDSPLQSQQGDEIRPASRGSRKRKGDDLQQTDVTPRSRPVWENVSSLANLTLPAAHSPSPILLDLQTTNSNKPRKLKAVKREFYDIHKFTKTRYNQKAAERLLNSTRKVDEVCRKLVNTCRILGRITGSSRDASLTLAVLDRSLFAYAQMASKKRVQDQHWHHPGGVVAFLEILQTMLEQMEENLQRLRRTVSMRSFGREHPYIHSFCTCGFLFGLTQVLRRFIPETDVMIGKAFKKLPNLGFSATLAMFSASLSRNSPRILRRLWAVIKRQGHPPKLALLLLWPFVVLKFAQWTARKRLWKNIDIQNKNLQLLVLYWRLCMASLENRVQSQRQPRDRRFSGNDIYRWMLAMVPPNADSERCFWYNNTPPMKLVKRCLDSMYTSCSIYHSWFGASQICSPCIVPLFTMSFIFHAFSQRRCNDIIAHPDIQLLSVMWQFLDSRPSYWAVLKIFPLLGICPELEMVETVTVRLDGLDCAQFCHDISNESKISRSSSVSLQETNNIRNILEKMHEDKVGTSSDQEAEGVNPTIAAMPARTVNLLIISRSKIDIRPSQPSAKSTIPTVHTRSENIIFFVHGGGWLAKFTAADMLSLSIWSNAWEVPVISVDYTLCPKGAYPTSLMEVYLAYKYVVNGGLGFRPRRIVVIGDSNGGNIAVSLVTKAILEDVKLPDALILTGAILSLSKADENPSRSLFMMDPLVPANLINQLRSIYLSSTCDPDTNPFISPLIVRDEILKNFPPTSFVVGFFDPFLDDSVSFAHRLDAVGVNTRMRIFSGMPHSVLSFYPISQDSRDAIQLVSSWIGVAFSET